MKRNYYFFRGEVIERFGNGWCWTDEMCRGWTSGIPVYKTVEDARNAIRKALDGTQKADPRTTQTAGWKMGTGWYVES